MNLVQACENIVSHYKKNINIKFVPNFHIIDGSVVDFYDEDSVVIASARIKIENDLRIDNKTGQMAMSVVLTDLCFEKRFANITAQYTPDKSEEPS